MENQIIVANSFEVEVLADSMAIESADQKIDDRTRLITLRLRYPRFIHSELMTHRMFSRNAASSRAIPAQRLRQAVLKDPARPVYWGANVKGMQATEPLTPSRRFLAKALWFGARYPACAAHWLMEKCGLHKQLINRVLEPWMWMESLWTGMHCEWMRMLSLRNHHAAQPEFAFLARLIQSTILTSESRLLVRGEWHAPYYARPGDSNHVPPNMDEDPNSLAAAIGRAARVSYLKHDGTASRAADILLYERLASASPPHASPLEHFAYHGGAESAGFQGNFGVPWCQYRKVFESNPKTRSLTKVKTLHELR